MDNPFDNPAFSLANLVASINILPNLYGRINDLGIFTPKGVSTRTIIIEERNGTLNMLPTMPVGSPGSVASSKKRGVRSFVIPHIPHDDVVLPSDVQGVRAFGSEAGVESVASVLNDKLQTMKNKHDITHEWMRMGALKGQILDADGSVIYDLFEEFGITKKSVVFDLATAGTDVRAKSLSVKRHIEQNLLGERMTGVRALVSKEFYDAFTGHAKVEKAYANYQEAQDRLGGDMRGGFSFGGVTYEEYNGSASDPDGTLRRFIDAGFAIAYPEGTGATFFQYAAPADFNETANTIGQVYYAKQEPRKFGRGTDLHTQSNPLPLCHRPGILVELQA